MIVSLSGTILHLTIKKSNQLPKILTIPVTTANLSVDVMHSTSRASKASDLKESDGSSMNCAARFPKVSRASWRNVPYEQCKHSIRNLWMTMFIL